MSKRDRMIEAMRQIAARLEKEIPEAQAVFEQVRRGNLTPEEALEQFSQLVMVNPEIAEKIQVASEPQAALGPSEEEVETALQNVPKGSEEALAQLGFAAQHLFYRDELSGKVKLNPMYQTAVMERLQFDGDVPELRMGGDLPIGQKAAVPVEHSGVSPVALGAKLEQASEEVTQEIETLREQRAEQADLALAEAAASSLEGNPETTALATHEAQVALAELNKPLDVPGYERGRKAELRVVEGPTGAELAQMPEKKKREYAYAAISTTQGRRSAVPSVLLQIQGFLSRKGYEVSAKDTWTRRSHLAQAQWTTTLNMGPEDISPNFSPIRSAGASLGAKLLKILQDGSVTPEVALELEVAPVNNYGERNIGWKAQIVLAGSVPQLGAP